MLKPQSQRISYKCMVMYGSTGSGKVYSEMEMDLGCGGLETLLDVRLLHWKKKWLIWQFLPFDFLKTSQVSSMLKPRIISCRDCPVLETFKIASTCSLDIAIIDSEKQSYLQIDGRRMGPIWMQIKNYSPVASSPNSEDTCWCCWVQTVKPLATNVSKPTDQCVGGKGTWQANVLSQCSAKVPGSLMSKKSQENDTFDRHWPPLGTRAPNI